MKPPQSLFSLLLLVSALHANAYSPYVDEAFPRQPLWGDTHLHSSLSTDAFGLGVTLGPDEAFKFASGQLVTSSWGLRVQLSRPLDFVVLADHAESLGMMERVKQGEPGRRKFRAWTFKCVLSWKGWIDKKTSAPASAVMSRQRLSESPHTFIASGSSAQYWTPYLPTPKP